MRTSNKEQKRFEDKGSYIICIIWSVIFSILSFAVINLGNFDYGFHLARIVGLAQSIRNLDFLPNLNFIFSFGTGYASPMFYGNWQFYFPAVIYLFTKNAVIAYTVFAFLVNMATILSGYYVYKDISKNTKASLLLACITPVFFSLYGFGMTAVVPLAILLIHALYLIVIEGRRKAIYLGIITSLLIQTHILSTLTLAIYALIFLIFNIPLLTKKKFISLFQATGIALVLSIGFILQFLEQANSQNFFYKWNNRSFPLPSENMFQTSSILKTVTEQVNYGGFASLVTPVLSLLVFTFFVFLLKTNLKEIARFPKSLIVVALFSLLLTSDLVPWKVLQSTFLGTFQYSYRLTFFIPILIIIVYLTSFSDKTMKYFAIFSLIFYFTSIVLATPFDKEKYINLNQQYNATYNGENNASIDPIGDEYYTIDVNNAAIRDGSIGAFSELNNINIDNVELSYNSIDFDFTVLNPELKASVVVPRFWYKGYIATYSDGGVGDQPTQEKVPFTDEEISENILLDRNFSDEKILNNGQIFLNLSESGHVSVNYQKTRLQLIGFLLEILAWLISVVVCIRLLFSKKNEIKH